MGSRFRVLGSAVLVVTLAVMVLGGQPAAQAARSLQTSYINWPGYLYGQTHSSDNTAATAITPQNAGNLTRDWDWTPPAPTNSGQPSGLLASPTVVNGVVYIGANTGTFYALSEATGKVLWSQPLGYVTGTTCGPLGIVSTATVEDSPNGGPLTVYVAGGDGYLYALDAATGAIDWQSVIAIPSTTENNYFDWSSPTVVNGNIYVGQSSNCDTPLINGGLKEYNQATGALENFYQTYPGHPIQASIWSSAAVDAADQNVFVTTGNGPGGDEASVVRLNATTLAREDGWAIPKADQIVDSDFGGSPTLFTATLNGVSTPMVGACNKNGTYYAFEQADISPGPVWTNAVGVPSPQHGVSECDAAAIWDGTNLYLAGNGATIGGTTYAGDIEMVDPATGTPSWQDGLPGPPIGSPTMDGSGVIAVTDYGIGSAAKTYTLELIDAATGAVLNTITIGPDFGQPVFADNKLFVPTQNRGLIVYSPSSASPPVASFIDSCNNLTCSFDASASTAPGSTLTSYAWTFGDGNTGSGETVEYTYAKAGTFSVTLTVTSANGLTNSLTEEVTVPPPPPEIAFVGAADANGNGATETVTIPSAVAPGDALVLVATGALDQSIAAPAGWSLVGSSTPSNGAMVTSVWSEVATAADPGQPVTVTFSTTNRKGNVELLAYSGTSTSSPVLAFATGAGKVSASTATTPALSITATGCWVVSGWEAKSSAVNTWTAESGQVVRDADYGSGSGRIDMIASDSGAPVAAGTVGGLTASTDQPFSADTTFTLVLDPAS